METNPMDRPLFHDRPLSHAPQVSRCGARARDGTPCRNPPVQGRRRCRLPGGLSPHAGRPVHFTTVARWQRQGLLTTARSSDPLAGMQAVRTTESAEPEPGPKDPFAELPLPVTPLEARRVWDEQRRPSSRSVAKALTQAGRPVHFTTVARWKKREWQVEARLEHPFAAAMRKIDLFAPLLTGDPTAKAVDIVGDIVRTTAANGQSMTADQGPDQVIRESCLTMIHPCAIAPAKTTRIQTA